MVLMKVQNFAVVQMQLAVATDLHLKKEFEIIEFEINVEKTVGDVEEEVVVAIVTVEFEASAVVVVEVAPTVTVA